MATAALDSAEKERLLAAGLWQQFTRLRKALQEKLPSKDARLIALQEVWAGHEGRPVRSTAQIFEDVEKQKHPPSGYEDLTDEEYSEFMSREADIVSQCVWVAKRLDAPADRLSVLDAPCAEAWSLLQDARSSRGRKSEFLEKIYAKLIPSRSALDGMKPGQQDGSHIGAAIERLLAIAQKAKQNTDEPDGLPALPPSPEGLPGKSTVAKTGTR